MKSCNLSFFALFLVLCFSNVYADIPLYQFIDLGVQESDSSEAWLINDKNEVLGQYYLNGEKNTFIWSQENGMKLIDYPQGFCPIKMNSRGQIIGYFQKANNKDKYFIWEESSGITPISIELDSGEVVDCVSLCDINDNGSVIGHYANDKITFGSFIWENGVVKILDCVYGDLGVENSCNANSINNQGDIVGFTNKSLFHKGKVYRKQNIAVIWRANDNYKISELLPYDDDDSIAYRINDSGHVFCEKISERVEKLIINVNENKVIQESRLARNPNLVSQKYLNSKYPSGVQSRGNVNKRIAFYELLPTGDVQYSVVAFTNIKQYSNIGVWKQIKNISSVNNLLWVIGSAVNIYGEQHAVLLAPMIK